MLNQSGQSQFYDREAIGELLANLINRCDQIIIVDLPPWVAGERAVNCQQKRPQRWFLDWICSHRCWGDRRNIDLHQLDELSDSISVDDTGDRSDREDLAGLWEGRRACEKYHLVRHGNSTHTPT